MDFGQAQDVFICVTASYISRNAEKKCENVGCQIPWTVVRIFFRKRFFFYDLSLLLPAIIFTV